MISTVASFKRLVGRIPGARTVHGRSRRILHWVDYCRDFAAFSKQASATRHEAPRWENRYPVLGEKTSATHFDRHYVYHTSWAARVLAQTRPTRHVDLSSSLYFVGIVSAFVPAVEHYDYRPPDIHLSSLTTGSANLLSLGFADESIESLSCMHVLEHVGLGRYGDPLDPSGDRQAMAELQRILAPGGNLLVVTPVGRPRICFNAHRIYSFEQIRRAFSGLRLKEFRLVPDDPGDGGLIEASPEVVATQDYGCGCFWFEKPR